MTKLCICIYVYAYIYTYVYVKDVSPDEDIIDIDDFTGGPYRSLVDPLKEPL